VKLAVYGQTLPLRLVDELIDGKTQELEHAATIRQLIPELEPPYRKLLLDWEQVFDKTREMAHAARQALQSQERSTQPSQWADTLPQLVDSSLRQSREFARQLELMQAHSNAIRNLPASPDGLIARDNNEEDDSPDGHGGPQPADAELRPEPGQQPADAKLRPEPMGDIGTSSGMPDQPVPIGGHKLPPLPYSYKALEPWIDEKTMRIHHDKHHLSYVEGLNTAEKKLEEARRTGNFDLVKHWERELAFNGAGHYLHTLFWNVMSPKGGGKPSGALLDEITRSFGSYDAFKKQFTEAAGKVEGGGWAILVWSPRSHRLEILTAEKHQNLSQWDVVPLLPLDVWEHAYYLKHQNDRAAYVRDWWNVVNWPYVAERFNKARQLQWAPT